MAGKNIGRYNFGISKSEISGERTCKRRSAKHLELPPVLLEGKRSIQLSYGRILGYSFDSTKVVAVLHDTSCASKKSGSRSRHAAAEFRDNLVVGNGLACKR
jgi:hypothetical protein